jgi:hypothetical protein
MFSTYQRARFLLGLSAGLSFVIAWVIGSMAAIPPERGHAISLVGHLSEVPAVLVTMIMALFIGQLIAGRIRFDAGLSSAAAALGAFSIRSGPMHTVLMSASSPDVYNSLILETILLYALLLFCWMILWQLHKRDLHKRDIYRDGVAEPVGPLSQQILALLVTSVIMAILVYFIAQTDDKKQALAAVGLAAFLATAGAHSMVPVSPSIFYWLAPMIVAIGGYFSAHGSPGAWSIGEIQQPLARALPLDYASAGTIGSVIGYWMSRRWSRAQSDEASQATTPGPA